jgi:hypothetical protein
VQSKNVGGSRAPEWLLCPEYISTNNNTTIVFCNGSHTNNLLPLQSNNA